MSLTWEVTESKERVYIGRRTEKGCRVFVREGNRLRSLRNAGPHSPTGFEWGYEGSGPADLAYSLLLDATQHRQLTERLYQQFKSEVVANLPHDHWEICRSAVITWALLAMPSATHLPAGGSGLLLRRLKGEENKEELQFLKTVWPHLAQMAVEAPDDDIGSAVLFWELGASGWPIPVAVMTLAFTLDRMLTALKAAYDELFLCKNKNQQEGGTNE